MKYEVGQLVRIKSLEECFSLGLINRDDLYNFKNVKINPGINSSMFKHFGSIVNITYLSKYNESIVSARNWSWPTEVFSPIFNNTIKLI